MSASISIARPGRVRLRVPVGGSRGITVDRAEVALAVHERIAEREVLDHPDHGVVDRGVPVRVVLAQHVTDDRRALLVARRPGLRTELAHRVQNAAVHGLETVPRTSGSARCTITLIE